MNFLEQLGAEYYTHCGYWVHHNIRLSRLGFQQDNRELDVVALHPDKQSLVHMELGGGFDSWEQLEKCYVKKKEAGALAYPRLFPGIALPPVTLRAVWSAPGTEREMSGWQVIPLRAFLVEIDRALPTADFNTTSVSEELPILRTLHLSRWLRR